MKRLFLFLITSLIMAFTGCGTIKPASNDVVEENAHKAAEFINFQSGLIQNGISGITQLAIYSLPEGSDKQHIIDIVHAITANLSNIVHSGSTDPEQIRKAFTIGDSRYDKIFETAGQLVNVKIQSLKENGYGDLTVAIISAAAKGLADGTGHQ